MGTAGPVDVFTRQEMDALLYDTIGTATPKGKRDHAIFVTAYVYMLRPSEVGLLRRADVDAENLRLQVRRVGRSIGGEFELHPIVGAAVGAYLQTRDDAAPALFISRNGNPISRQALDLLMKQYGERAGLPESKRHFRVLRRTGITHWLEASPGDRDAVRERAGHRTATTTHRYLPVTGARQGEVARQPMALGSLALRSVAWELGPAHEPKTD